MEDKPYLLFAGLYYYPSGGWHDYRGRFATLKEATTAAADLTDVDWWHVAMVGHMTVLEYGNECRN